MGYQFGSVFFLEKLPCTPEPGLALPGSLAHSPAAGALLGDGGAGRLGQSPPVGEEAPVGVAGAVAAWGGAGGPLVLQGLPGGG